MDYRYFESLSVDEMARAAGLSRAHFSREFAKAFGESPHQYVLTRRLERAAALLRTTDWPVSRICTEVGLASVGSFTTSFARMSGKTPTAYRAASAARIPICQDPAVRRQTLRSAQEPHVSRRGVASDTVGSSVLCFSDEEESCAQDRQRPVLGT